MVGWGWIIGAFAAGEAAGFVIAAIVSGTMDRYMERKRRRYEQKRKNLS